MYFLFHYIHVHVIVVHITSIATFTVEPLLIDNSCRQVLPLLRHIALSDYHNCIQTLVMHFKPSTSGNPFLSPQCVQVCQCRVCVQVCLVPSIVLQTVKKLGLLVAAVSGGRLGIWGRERWKLENLCATEFSYVQIHSAWCLGTFVEVINWSCKIRELPYPVNHVTSISFVKRSFKFRVFAIKKMKFYGPVLSFLKLLI